MSDKVDPGLVLEISRNLQQGQRRQAEDTADSRRSADARFASVDVRIASMDARFEAVIALLEQHTRRLDTLTRDVVRLKHDLAALRQTVTQYHGSVLGHGVLITELEGNYPPPSGVAVRR